MTPSENGKGTVDQGGLRRNDLPIDPAPGDGQLLDALGQAGGQYWIEGSAFGHRVPSLRATSRIVDTLPDSICKIATSGQALMETGKTVQLVIPPSNDWRRLDDLEIMSPGFAFLKVSVGGFPIYRRAHLHPVMPMRAFQTDVVIGPEEKIEVEVMRIAPEHGRCVVAVILEERPPPLACFSIPVESLESLHFTPEVDMGFPQLFMRSRIHGISRVMLRGADALTMLEHGDKPIVRKGDQVTIELVNRTGIQDVPSRLIIDAVPLESED